MSRVELSAVVVAWRAASDVAELVAAWPTDARAELLIVDQSRELPAAYPNARVLRPERNLGFAGGANFGAAAAAGSSLLFLNPDVRPEPGAIAALVDGFAAHPEAAGLVPRLAGFDGAPQHAWQLRRLPAPLALLAHAGFVNPGGGPRAEPAAGTPIEQPAAAALALDRARFERLGGFDAGFFTAWFEDVDLAKRYATAGERLLYFPRARFRHRQGSSVATLGYRAFLEAYDRNLARYLAKHHGRAWALAFRALVPPAALARLLLLPLRRPQRAASRGAAAAALLAVAAGSLRGWPLAAEAIERAR